MRRVPDSAIASRTLSVPSTLTWWLPLRPGAVSDDVRTGYAAPDRALVADVRRDELGRARPTFGPMPGDADDIVALAEQSGGEAAAEYPTGPGDRDSH